MTVSRQHLRPVGAAVLLLLTLAACGSGSSAVAGSGASGLPASGAAVRELPEASPPNPNIPPPVTLRYGDGSVTLMPYTFCYRSGCADGVPPADPPDIGSPAEVEIDFPLDSWTFDAGFRQAGTDCGRVHAVSAEPSADGRLILRPAGFAGTHDVTLTGRGDGELITVFRWSTPSDGPLAQPRAWLGVLADDNGEVVSYDVELVLANMASTPRQPRPRSRSRRPTATS